MRLKAFLINDKQLFKYSFSFNKNKTQLALDIHFIVRNKYLESILL